MSDLGGTAVDDVGAKPLLVRPTSSKNRSASSGSLLETCIGSEPTRCASAMATPTLSPAEARTERAPPEPEPKTKKSV
jgi:hypothetical protein